MLIITVALCSISFSYSTANPCSWLMFKSATSTVIHNIE